MSGDAIHDAGLLQKKELLACNREEVKRLSDTAVFTALKRAFLNAQANLLAFEIGQAECAQRTMTDVRPMDLRAFCTDDYPRAGCTLVICLEDDAWSMNVYAGGAVIVAPQSARIVESYFPRPYGSTGIAVDAFIEGGTAYRKALPAMAAAERRYSALSGSKVIS